MTRSSRRACSASGSDPWLRFRANRAAYHRVDAATIRERKRSDTVYVFGSGASLNDVTAEEWSAIARHDTIGFNWFVHERYVRCDYHMIRGIPDSDLDHAVWGPQLDEYFGLIASNPCFAETCSSCRAASGRSTATVRSATGCSRLDARCSCGGRSSMARFPPARSTKGSSTGTRRSRNA